MPIAHSVYVDNETRRLTLTSGATLDLRFEIGGVGIYVKNVEVGRLSFRHYETDGFGNETIDVCRLTHAFLEGGDGIYKRHGVGTEAVRFYLQSTDCQLELPENDGIRKEDGSHLVKDGPAFVASLIKKSENGDL